MKLDELAALIAWVKKPPKDASLRDWAESKRLRPHKTSKDEIAGLLGIVERALTDAGALECWGDNHFGQVSGPNASTETFQQVSTDPCTSRHWSPSRSLYE